MIWTRSRNGLAGDAKWTQIPLGEVAKVELSPGPSMIRDEERATHRLRLH